MEIKDFLLFASPILLIELLAALAGTYYLKKSKSIIKHSKALVYFLWTVFLVELVGLYSGFAYYTNYEYFSFVKGTLFESNLWWYNSFAVISFAFLSLYFISFLKNRTMKFVFTNLTGLFSFASVISFFFSDNFFDTSSVFITISGTLLILCIILYFYYELLRSDLILRILGFLPFYVSIGLLVFNLTVTPVDLLSKYFTTAEDNEIFVSLYLNVYLFANFFLYLSIIIGFLVCTKKKFLY